MKNVLITALGAGILAACTSISMPEAPEGKALFDANCAQCHGAGARGDGPAAQGMTPAPSDLTRLAQGGTFPRARVLSIIDGYDRTGLPGHSMPEFGAQWQGDTVPVDTGDGIMTPTPRPLAALLAYLETVQE